MLDLTKSGIPVKLWNWIFLVFDKGVLMGDFSDSEAQLKYCKKQNKAEKIRNFKLQKSIETTVEYLFDENVLKMCLLLITFG